MVNFTGQQELNRWQNSNSQLYLQRIYFFLMSKNNFLSIKMRLIHRYLVFFLAGIMTYALSGIVLIFIDTDSFKNARAIETTVDLN